MPGTTGCELADRVRAMQDGIKVLFMSGYTDASSITERITVPGFGYLEKPFTPQALAVKVRESLDQRLS
jgi:DNA-binding NtrC family response regulator